MFDNELLQLAAENSGNWLVVCGDHIIDMGEGPIYATYDLALSAARAAEERVRDTPERCVAIILTCP